VAFIALTAEQTTVFSVSVRLSLSSNNTVTISGTDCTDLRRDGQAELASAKQDVSQNRPWLICEKENSCEFYVLSSLSVP